MVCACVRVKNRICPVSDLLFVSKTVESPFFYVSDFALAGSLFSLFANCIFSLFQLCKKFPAIVLLKSIIDWIVKLWQWFGQDGLVSNDLVLIMFECRHQRLSFVHFAAAIVVVVCVALGIVNENNLFLFCIKKWQKQLFIYALLTLSNQPSESFLPLTKPNLLLIASNCIQIIVYFAILVPLYQYTNFDYKNWQKLNMCCTSWCHIFY